jgi:hypothetical protein
MYVNICGGDLIASLCYVGEQKDSVFVRSVFVLAAEEQVHLYIGIDGY